MNNLILVNNHNIKLCACGCGEECKKTYKHGHNPSPMKGKPSPLKGIPRSEETKRKLSKKNKGRKVGPCTEERKQKLRKSCKGLNTWSKGKPSPMKGKHHTEETKQKISKKNKGKVGPRKGKHCSETTKQKISEANKGKSNIAIKGKPKTQEHKDKIANTLKGTKVSEEIKQKRREARKGKKGPNFGKKASDETRLKQSLAHKGKHPTEESIRKSSEARKGKKRKPMSEELKKKQSEIHKAIIKNSENIKFRRSKPEIELGKQIEKIFGIILPHSKRLDGRVFDYCYEPKKILIESDGKFWHSTPRAKIVDQEKNEIAKNNGYILIRYTLNYEKDVKPFIQDHYEELKQIFSNQEIKEEFVNAE